MDAIIMCAGRGSRLSPITDKIPKCMVELKNKSIIKRSIDTLTEAGISNIIIVTRYKEDILKLHLKSYNKLKFAHQHEMDGTARAIHHAKKWIKYNSFIVISGDIVYKKADILRLMKMENSLLYTELDTKLYEYGTLDYIESDTSGIIDINYINEKVSRPTSNYVNCGAYHFTKDVFDYIEITPKDIRYNEVIITNTSPLCD